jgi:hypothetical protein
VGLLVLLLVVSAEAVSVSKQTSDVAMTRLRLKQLEEADETTKKVVNVKKVPSKKVPSVTAGKIDKSKSELDTKRKKEMTSDEKQKEEIEDQDERILHTQGTLMMTVFLTTALVLFSSLMAVLFIVDHNTPPSGLEQTSGKVTCRNWFECIFVPLIILGAMVAGVVVYILKIKPAEEDAKMPSNSKFYKIVGPLSFALAYLMIFISVMFLLFFRGNRAAGFVISFGLSMMFLFLLFVQGVVAFMIGAWKPFFSERELPHATISHSMNYLGGVLAAVFGMVLTVAMTPLAETFVYENDQKFSWGRGMRVLTSSLGVICLLLTALVPLGGKDHDSRVDKSWQLFHYILAGLTFGLLYIYMWFVTADHCLVEGRSQYCNFMPWLGITLATLAGVMMVIVVILHTAVKGMAENPIVRSLFAFAEYMMVVAIPLTVVTRFDASDMKLITNALVRWETKRTDLDVW